MRHSSLPKNDEEHFERKANHSLLFQTIILYYKDEECQAIMRQLFIEVIVYNFQLFESTADAELSNISDVLESFYAFNSLVAKKIPQAFADVNIDCIKLIRFGNELYTAISFCFDFSSILNYVPFSAMKAMTLPETGPSKHAVMFLQHFVMQSRALPNVTSAVLKCGEEIIHTTLLCIGIYTLRTHVDVFADIFVALNKKYPAELIAWMKILELPNFPTTFVTPQEKEQFMKAIIR